MIASPPAQILRIALDVAKQRGAQNLELSGAGTEFCFYRAHRDGRWEGYRIARSEVFNTANNPGVSAEELQHKELALSAWALESGVPSAGPLGVVKHEQGPVLIMEFINDDDSAVDQFELGRLLARLHRAPPPENVDGIPKPTLVYAHIAQRLTSRYRLLQSSTSLPALPSQEHISSALEQELQRESLLHMDIRRQNIRALRGEIKSLFDWSNALVAAPEVELARINQYAAISDNGLEYATIRQGYLQAGGTMCETSEVWRWLSLDAAVMLAGVFSSVAPDEKLKQLYLARIQKLLH